MLADSGNTALQVVVALSIFVPLVVTAVLAWVVLRGRASDPDEQRWRRLAEQRRESGADER